MIDLLDRRVLIVGGAGNVGGYLVREALAAGATVIAPSRRPDRLRALERTIAPEQRDRLVALTGDMSDEQDAPRVRSA